MKQNQEAALTKKTSGFEKIGSYWDSLNKWWNSPKADIKNNPVPVVEPILLNERQAPTQSHTIMQPIRLFEAMPADTNLNLNVAPFLMISPSRIQPATSAESLPTPAPPPQVMASSPTRVTTTTTTTAATTNNNANTDQALPLRNVLVSGPYVDVLTIQPT